MTATETATVTDEQIDAMTAPQLRDLLSETWQITEARLLRNVRKDDLLKRAHAWLALAQARGTDTPLPVTPDKEAPAESPTPPTSPDYPAAPEQPDIADQPADHPGVELEVAPEPGSVPSMSKWQQIMDIADTVAMANLAPADLRGKGNIGNARLVLLAAHDLGIPITQAIQKLAPVNGRLVMSAELMAALIRRDGHRLAVPVTDWSGCTVIGTRVDTGESMEVTFTLDDAQMAGLISGRQPETGFPIARSKDGNPLPWQQYPADLCYARAISRLGRRLFPDCLGGISYTAEELGDTGDYDAGASFGASAPVPSSRPEANQTIDEQRAALGVRIAELPEGLQATLRDEWKRRNLPVLKSATVGALRTIRTLVEQAEKEAEPKPDDTTDTASVDVGDDGQPIDEAEVVEESAASTTPASDAPPLDVGPELEADPICESCKYPITPGLADDGTGEMKQQPIRGTDGKDYHAACAPF